MLAAALAVALPGEAAVAGQRAAGPAGGQAQVDPGADGVGALGLLLGAAGGEDHGGFRGAEQGHGLAEPGDRYPRDALDQFRPVSHGGRPGLLPAGGAGGDELLVDPAFRDDQVQQAEREGEVGAGARGEVQVGLFGGAGAARVDDDQGAAARLEFGEVAQGGRHGLGQVRADEDHAAGARDVRQGEGQPAVEAEGSLVGGGGRGHAEAAVVVDLRGAQGDAGELAERVGLLVGEPAAAEDPDGVRAVGAAGTGEACGDGVESLLPGGRLQLPGVGADERLGQAHPGGEHGGGGAALAAQRAPVDGEVGPFLHRHGGTARLGAEPHAALQGAVRAVRVDGGVGGVHTVQRGSAVLHRPPPRVTSPGAAPQRGRTAAVRPGAAADGGPGTLRRHAHTRPSRRRARGRVTDPSGTSP